MTVRGCRTTRGREAARRPQRHEPEGANQTAELLRSAPPTQEPHFRQSASDTSTDAPGKYLRGSLSSFTLVPSATASRPASRERAPPPPTRGGGQRRQAPACSLGQGPDRGPAQAARPWHHA